MVGKPPRLGQFSTAPREVPTSTVLHDGAAVLAGAIVFAGAELGEAVTLGDQASVRELAVVGAKTTIGRGSAVDNDVRIGERVRIQTNCYITAYTIVEDDVFLAPGVVTTNDNTMARHAPGESITGPTLVEPAASAAAPSSVRAWKWARRRSSPRAPSSRPMSGLVPW